MARLSTIPKEIKQYAPHKCCRIRCDNGVYRVYKYSAEKLQSGKWGASSGILIGKTIPNKGFIPNKRYLAEFQKKEDKIPFFDDTITDIAYGQYDLLRSMSGDVLTRLERFFPAERVAQIYCYAIIPCANGFVYIDQIDDFYQESFLSLVFKNYIF